ncbi:MAG: hypothetical protein HY897_25045 [Deltaproteobacteria bacterium]|nr:hypothetical protein [Deltaproteobacteria bacterium]
MEDLRRTYNTTRGKSAISGRKNADGVVSGPMGAAEDIDRFDHMIDSLKKEYELFFSGMERKEPSTDRAAVERMARQLHTAFITNSAMIYRLRSVATKLTTYQTYWDRVLRQMEEGTFQREIDKRKLVQRDMAIAREAERKGEGYVSMGEYLDGALDDEIGKAAEDALSSRARDPAAAPAGDGHARGTPPEKARAPAERPAAPPPSPAPPRPSAPRSAPAAPTAKPPAAAAGIPKERVKELYDAYVTARRTLGDRNVNVSFEGFARQIDKQIPGLREKYKTGSIDFKVSIKGGKASLRAVVGGKEDE